VSFRQRLQGWLLDSRRAQLQSKATCVFAHLLERGGSAQRQSRSRPNFGRNRASLDFEACRIKQDCDGLVFKSQSEFSRSQQQRHWFGIWHRLHVVLRSEWRRESCYRNKLQCQALQGGLIVASNDGELAEAALWRLAGGRDFNPEFRPDYFNRGMSSLVSRNFENCAACSPRRKS